MSAFSDAVLATDADLSKYESKMPALATKMGVYDGKRELAKSYLGRRLRQRGVDLDQISDTSPLGPAAIFKELELMFRDMSEHNDSIGTQKAETYRRQFEEELELLVLDLSDGSTVTPTVTSIRCYRA